MTGTGLAVTVVRGRPQLVRSLAITARYTPMGARRSQRLALRYLTVVGIRIASEPVTPIAVTIRKRVIASITVALWVAIKMASPRVSSEPIPAPPLAVQQHGQCMFMGPFDLVSACLANMVSS
jgi:hypothetical protein